MIDIDALENLVKTVTEGAAAQKSEDPVIRNMGRLEFDDACKQYMRATNPAAIRELIAEVRALRERRNGPGSPTARLHHLIDELDERFPDAIDKYSSAPQDHKYLEAIDAAIARGRAK